MQVHCFETPVELSGQASPWQEPIFKSLVLIATLAVMLFVMFVAIFLVATRPTHQSEPETNGGQGNRRGGGSGGPALAISTPLGQAGFVLVATAPVICQEQKIADC